MLKVDGGFAKVVNVMPFHDGEDTIELTIYIKLFCADEEARYELVYALEEHGFDLCTGENDKMWKKTSVNIFGGAS